MKIKEIREYREIPLREMAKRLKISASHLSDIEKGKKTPSAALYDRMIREYGEGLKDWFEVITVRKVVHKMFSRELKNIGKGVVRKDRTSEVSK